MSWLVIFVALVAGIIGYVWWDEWRMRKYLREMGDRDPC